MKRGLLLLGFSLLIGVAQAQVSINPCAALSDIHVVVIGSSTAAGSGPSVADSAWVNRYRKYLQEINPNNLVTNLAIGGTTTYHIMPSWFVPPAGKPNPNPNNNVTQCIALAADAIVLNMPSNDAANNFSTTEQMFNFRTIKESADSAGIPVWICTTQPRNGFNAVQIQIQTDVRDSVLAEFNPFTLDFWTGFADANNGLATQWDSGDGVHMNDAAHGVLNQRVINAGIPNVIADTLPYTDHAIGNLWIDGGLSACGDSVTIIKAVIGNLGLMSTSAIQVHFDVYDNVAMTNNNQTVPLVSALNACEADTIQISLNTYNASNLDLKAWALVNEMDASNDSSNNISLQTVGHPNITVPNTTTVCQGTTATINAVSSDTVLWYDAAMGGNIIGGGPVLNIPNVQGNQNVWAQAVRGNLYFDKSLFTTANTTTNWNGLMFNIIAHTDLTIDSLKFKAFDTGPQILQAYRRNGTYAGNEMNQSAWTYWGYDSVQVNSQGSFHIVQFPTVSLQSGDTLGVYLYMDNSAARLSYQNVSSITVTSNTEMSIESGSGVSHTFGAIYTPRNWSGEVFYHHGFNATGSCATNRELSSISLNPGPLLNLGNDTTLYVPQTITLNNNLSLLNYQWSTGATTPQLIVDVNDPNFNLGQNTIWLQAEGASSGCASRDTIVVIFEYPAGVEDFGVSDFAVYPNPVQTQFRIDGIDEPIVQVSLFDMNGSLLKQWSKGPYNIDALPNGLYTIDVKLEFGQKRLKLLKH